MSFIFLPPSEGGGSIYVIDPVGSSSSLPLTAPTGATCLALDTGIIWYFDGSSWEETDAQVSPSAVSDTNSIDLTVSSGVLSGAVRLSSTGPSGNNTAITLDIQGGGSPGLRAQLPSSATPVLAGLSLETNSATVSDVLELKNLNNTANNGSRMSFHSLNSSSVEYEAARFEATHSEQTAGAEGTDFRFYHVTNGTLQEHLTMRRNRRTGINSPTPSGFFHVAANIGNSGIPTLIVDGASGQSEDILQIRNSSAAVLASISETGHLTAASYEGVATGSAAAVGSIGEIITAEVASATGTGVGATGAWGSVTSIALTAGAWDIDGVVGFTENSSTLTTSLSCGISTSATGVGINQFNTTQMPVLISGTADMVVSTPKVSLVVSGATTVHLNTRFFYTAGSPQHRGRIRAIRRAQ